MPVLHKGLHAERLIGIGNALKDGQTTVEEEFPQLQQPAAEGKMNDKVSKLKKAAAKKNPAEMSEEEIEAAMSEEQTKLNME